LATDQHGALESEKAKPGTSRPGQRLNLAEQEPVDRPEQNPLLPPGEYKVTIVGQEHISRLHHALVPILGGPERIPLLQMEGMTPELILEAASALKTWSLSNSIVLLWPYEDEVFIQEEHGTPLTRDHIGRLHCEGTLGLIEPKKMQRLWEQVRPIIEACKQAVHVILITPMPIYLSTPCCEDPDHCTNFGRPSYILKMCREAAGLYDATLRWASRLNSDKPMHIGVAAPHSEIMEAAKQEKEDPTRALLNSFSHDGIHLTYSGYTALGNIFNRTTVQGIWRLMPPAWEMWSPPRGPPRQQATRNQRRFNPWTDDLNLAIGRPRISPDRVAVYTDEDIRAAERGPWRNSELQDRGSPIPADVWAEARRSAQEKGHRPSAQGGQPG
jgi:hypothetical protein